MPGIAPLWGQAPGHLAAHAIGPPRSDSEQRAYRHLGSQCKRVEHRGGRLTRSNDVHGAGASKRFVDVAGKRATDKTSGIHRRQGFAKNDVEMLSKRGNDGQFTCRGSAQAERPATRSTC
jgi:hypothetical protein